MKGKFVNTQIWITCVSSTRSKKQAKLSEKGNEFLKGHEIIWTKGNAGNSAKAAKLVA